MKKALFFILGVNFLFGCRYSQTETDMVFSGDPDFTVSLQLAEGKSISAMVVTDENHYYYSTGKKLFSVVNGSETSVELSSDVFSIALNPADQSLWMGTRSSGLACLKKGSLRYYDQQSDLLPRNLVQDVVCDPSGKVWFNCSAHRLGGLGCFSDGNMTFYTPANSVLPDNLIKSLVCRNGIIYVATGGTVTQQKVVSIEEGNWETLSIQGYYLMDMDVDGNGCVYVIDDSGLSSSMLTNKIYFFDYNQCTDILLQKSRWDSSPYLLKTDLRNYLWVAQFTQTANKNLNVFDGNTWHSPPEGFPEMYIKCMSVDKKNNLWLGTDKGIFILNQ